MPQRRVKKPEVWINGSFAPFAHAVSVYQGVGGLRMNAAEVQIDLGHHGYNKRNIDRTLGDGLGVTIEVFTRGASRVHLGVADREEARISGQESKTLISTLPPRWFGKTLWGQRQYNPGSSRLRHPLVDDTITFNPIVDGKYEPNMRTNFLPGAGYNIFVDPGATKSQSSRNYHGIANGAHEWRLADALKYVCWESNPLEERILNPAVNGNGEVDGMKLDQVLFNMTLRTGGYLPETLDALLEPFGYTWFVDVAAGGKPQMHVMKLGEPWTNLKTYLYLQRPGSVVSIAESDTSELLALDIAHSDTDRINAVRTRGGRKLIEATFELIPGWDKQYDGYWHEDQQNYLPAKDEPAWKTSPHLQDVHRKWVLNEAGDYNTLRGVSTTDLSVLLQQGIAEVFQNPETWIVLPKRRRFHPTLTCDKNGDPVGTTHGVLVERWAWEQGSQAKWVPLNTEEDDHQSFVLLDKECGIYFTGALVSHLMRAGYIRGEARIRVTATIELDTPIELSTPNVAGADRRELVIDFPTRFRHHYYWEGQDAGKISQSSLWFGGNRADYTTKATDQSEEMLLFAVSLRDAWNMADVSGQATIEGVDLRRFYLGEAVLGVMPRKFMFQAAASRWPQVVGVTFDINGQQTILELRTTRPLDSDISRIISDKRARRVRDELT
jgi:hypothetical protein